MPKPGFAEQRRIARILSTVQTAIAQQERLLALTGELKATLLRKLFTEGLRGEPQKMTEIGLVPESWKMTTLGEIASKPEGIIQTGPFGSQLHKHDYQAEGIPVVNPTHFLGNRINHSNLPRITSATAKRLEKYVLRTGDILFARRGEIGRHAVVTERENGWLCGTGSFLVRVNKPWIDNRFLDYLFTIDGIVNWLSSHAAGVIMPNLNNAILTRMPVPYPSFDLQTEIADCLKTIDKKLGLATRKRDFLFELFRTLLHQLMTAQLRV